MRRILPMAFAAWSLSATAVAQTPPPAPPAGRGGQAAASAGATEIEGQGKFGAVQDPTAVKPDAPVEETELSLATGGIISTGNAQSMAITGNGNFRLRRGLHQFGAIAVGNWAASKTPPGWRDTVGNAQGRLRYDAFFAKHFSAFLMATGRHDRFQGLEFRLNVDPGIAAYALSGPANRLWFEAGYDFQVDVRTAGGIVAKDADGNPIRDMSGAHIRVADPIGLNHAVRLFAGYSNRMSEKIAFDTGFEFLQSVIVAGRFRFVYDLALTFQLIENLSLSTTFTLRYENQPLPDIKKLDTITAFNLVYRFI